MKKFKQGQTVHIVSADFNGYQNLLTYFLYSQKEPLPEEGCVIQRMPVNQFQKICDCFPQDFVTHSRRKALSRLKMLNRNEIKIKFT